MDNTLEQRIAKALALNYYQGAIREKYKSKGLLSLYGGPVSDNPEAAHQWIEEQVVNQSETLWRFWLPDAAEILKT